eukprot:248388_1
MENKAITVQITLLGIASFVASLWALIASGLSSLAITQEWFDTRELRGTVIISLGISTVIARFTVLCCGKACGESDRLLALSFICIASFSDAIFDIIQGVIFLSGFTYSAEVNYIVIIGTWIGFGDEILEFLEEIIGNCCQACEENFCLCVFKIWLFIILIDCLVEQGFGIYIAFNVIMAQSMVLFIVAAVLNGLGIFLIICFGLYIACNGRAARRLREQRNVEMFGHTDV